MDALRPLFGWLAAHTYLVVFVGTIVDATGLPFPGRLVLVGAGALAATGDASVLLVIALAAAGAMLVDQVWYLTVTRGSGRLVDLYCRVILRQPGCREDDGEYFRRFGGATIIAGRFFTSVRVLAWPFAAAHGVGYGRFVVLDAVGATLWASIWVLLGWFVGEHWRSAAQSLGGWAAIGGALIILALAAPLAFRATRRAPRSRTLR